MPNLQYVLCGLVLLTTIPLSAQETVKKAAVPTDAAQAEATKVFKEVYGNEYSMARTTTEKQALAQKLLGKANESKDDPAAQFVLLRLTREIAAQAGDGQTAFQAIDAMGEVFDVDASEMKFAVLTKFVSLAEKPEQQKSVAEEALKLADQAVSQGSFSVAEKFAKLAVDEARKARDKVLLIQAQDRVTEVAEQARVYEAVKAAQLTLEKAPDDPAANLVLGKYFCFVRGDWAKGVPMLALGKDEDFSALAKKDLEGSSGSLPSKEQAKLGDGCWDLAEKQDPSLPGTAKREIQARAGYWYRQALPGLSGLTKDKVEKRLKEITPPQAETLLTGGTRVTSGSGSLISSGSNTWLEVLPHIDLKKDLVSGEWTKTAKGLVTQKSSRIRLPIKPEGDYEMAVTFTRAANSNSLREVLIFIPVGTAHCRLVLDGWNGQASGLDKIDDRWGDSNPTTIRSRLLADGRRYTVVIKVNQKGSEASIAVLLDKRAIIQWEGKMSSLSMPDGAFQPGQPELAANGSSVVFHSIQLRSVSGKLELLK